MADSVFNTKDNAAVFIQPDGPNTEPKYLGCVDVDDIAEPLGDLEIAQCVDETGNYKTVGTMQGAPGIVTTALTTFLQKALGYVERIKFPFTLFVVSREGGLANNFSNYVRASALRDARVVSRALVAPARRNETAQQEQSFDLAAPPPVFHFYPMLATRQSISETQALRDLAFNQDDRQATSIAPRLAAGDSVFVTAAAGAAVSANVQVRQPSGAYAAGAADPFAVDIDAGPVARVVIDAVTPRAIVGRGETVAGQPAAIAISDDNGATWTVVNVGSTNAQFFLGPRTIFAWSQYDIWAVTSGGFVYKSENGGISWTAQDAGLATTQDLHAVTFFDASIGYAVGKNNSIIMTRNGGLNWQAVTGPAGKSAVTINTVSAPSENRIWIGYNDGTLWYSEDQGATWQERVVTTGGASPAITSVDFITELQGILARNAGGVARVFQTIDGGYSWKEIKLAGIVNAGLTTLKWVSSTLALGVGPASGGTGFMLRIEAVTQS